MTHDSSFRSRLAQALAVAATLSALAASPAFGASGASRDDARIRCGWFDHPSPGNATLADHDGEWAVAMQGAASADGPWPQFKGDQWVRTGAGAAGYGCACLTLREDGENSLITHIFEARPQALSVCRQDKELAEPVNPLK